MDVILTQDVGRLGTAGQTVHVKDGYARNYLLPQGLAVPVNARTAAHTQALATARARAAEAEKAKAETLAEQLRGRDWVIPVSVGEQGKMHGAVTAADLSELLQKEGISLEKHQIDLERPLSQVGKFQVPLKLHAEVKAVLKVQLVSR